MPKPTTTPTDQNISSWAGGTVVLKAIDHSVLVVSGSDDIMLPDSDAYLMYKQLKSAQLILYPDSGRLHLVNEQTASGATSPKRVTKPPQLLKTFVQEVALPQAHRAGSILHAGD